MLKWGGFKQEKNHNSEMFKLSLISKAIKLTPFKEREVYCTLRRPIFKKQQILPNGAWGDKFQELY